jgi:hypothetical protein
MKAQRLCTTPHHRTRAARSAKPTSQSLPHHRPMKLALECQPTHARLRIARCQVHRCLLRSLYACKSVASPRETTTTRDIARLPYTALRNSYKMMTKAAESGRGSACKRRCWPAEPSRDTGTQGQRKAYVRHVCRSCGQLMPHCKERVSRCNSLVRTSGDHVDWCHCDVVLARRLQCAASRCYQTGAIR